MGGRRRGWVVLAAVGALVVASLPARGDEPAAEPVEGPAEIRIVRDRFGVPHVFGPTAEDVAYGAGYALAQDRLWQMHTFRLIGKGRLSELLGPPVVATDKTIRLLTYTAAEREARFATYPADIRASLQAFVDGINAWIAEVRRDPSKLPFEFVEFGVGVPPEWTIDDSVALQDVLILAFGSGGGNELNHARLLQALVERFGEAEGRQAFDDLVVRVDDDGPITIPRDFPYRERPTFAREDEAQARRALWPDARLGLGPTSAGPAPGPGAARALPAGAGRVRGAAVGTAAQARLVPDPEAAVAGLAGVQRGLDGLRRVFRFGSNAQIMGPGVSEAGNSLQTAGPQVGYLLPQWLADFGLHSADGRIDTTGMTFAGAGPAVLIGRGRGYAWTTTTGASDLTDTYVEQLNPANPRQYLFGGAFEDMECREETFTFRGVPFDRMEVCRTRHGPVVSTDLKNGVAYAWRLAWFNREGQTVEGFFRYNEVKSLEDFATFANFLSSNHNMFYVDDQGHYGYWHPGNFPVRAAGVDIRLPQDGTGGSEWQGLLPIGETPHAVDFERGWLVNWNNQPAVGWERERGHPALDNASSLERVVDPSLPAEPDPEGGLVNPDRRFDFEDLSANLRYAAFRHHRDLWFRPFLPEDAELTTDLARQAAAVVRGWDGFNTDRNGDRVEDSAGRLIVDTWVNEMRTRAFRDDLPSDFLFGWAREDLLWHLLNPDDTLQQGFDWLDGADPRAFAAEAFEGAVAALAARFGNADPSTWREPARLQHYQRLNADLFADLAQTSAGLDASGDTGLPGDVPDHIRMDRGTYNHVVAYQTEPAGVGLGNAVAKAGSVIPPGQSGHVDLAGREARHYEDQWALYVDWRYKPMPLTLAEARAVGESETRIVRPNG